MHASLFRRPLPGIVVVALVAVGCGSESPMGPSASAPKITCAADLAVQTTAASTTVTYTQPSVAGGATPVSVACAPTTGSVFPLGTSKVTCIAADAQSRTDTCSLNVTVQRPPVVSAARFLAFGDSITAGALSPCPAPSSVPSRFNLESDLRLVIASINVPTSYPAKLEGLLKARYATQSPIVFNEGVGGERAAVGVTRLPGLLIQDAPHALLLQEGVNDVTAGDAVVNALRTMTRQARGRGIPVFLGTLLPERAGACRAFTPGAIPPVNVQIRALAAAEGAVLVDLYQAFEPATSTLLGPDGLHPNEAGYDKMAQMFYDAIREWLEGGLPPF